MANAGLEITLSFRPIMDGFNRFVSAVESRLDRVRQYNAQIGSGAQATNALLGQAATLISGAGIVSFFTGAIREGVRYNATIEQQSSAFETLLGSADRARERIAALVDFAAKTPFELPEIVNASKLLQSFTKNALSTGDGLRLVGDAAAAVGAPIGAVAMWMGRLYAALQQGAPLGEPIQNLTQLGLISGKARGELFKLQGQAQTTSEVMEVMRNAFGFTSGAMERQAGTLNGLLSTMHDSLAALYGAATKGLAERLKSIARAISDLSANTAVIGLFSQIADKIAGIVEGAISLVRWLGQLGPNGQLTLQTLVSGFLQFMTVLAAVVVPLLFITNLTKALPALIRPIGSALVLLTGVSFTDMLRDLQLFSRELGWVQSVNLLSWGQLAAAGLGIVGAAIAGIKLGQFINEITVAGMKVKDWAAIVVAMVEGKITDTFYSLQEVWIKLKAGWDSFQLHVRATALEMAIAVADAWNRLPFGKKIDTSEWEMAVARMTTEIAGLDEKTSMALKAVLDKRVANILETGELMKWIADHANPAAPGAQPEAPTPTAPPDRPDKVDESKIEQKRKLFALETAIRAAELRGDQAEVDRLSRLRSGLELESTLGKKALGLINSRLVIEDALRDKERQRQEQDLNFSRTIGELDQRRAVIENDRLLTDDQKHERIIKLLRQENDLVRQRIAAAEVELRNGATDERRAQLEQQIDQDRSKLANNSGYIQANEPLSMTQSVAAGLVDYLRQVQTLAQQVRTTVLSIGQALQQGIASSITGLINRTMTWRDALLNIAQSVVSALIAAFANMLAQWIANQIMMALFGKALQAAQLAATVPIALETAALWQPAAIAASIASYGAAAGIGAGLAEAAIWGSALAFALGGVIPGGEQLVRVNENGTESILNSGATSMVGGAFVDRLNKGVFDLTALPSSVANGITRPDYSAAAGAGAGGGGAAAPGSSGSPVNVYNAFFNDPESAARWLSGKRGVRRLVRIQDRNRDEFGIQS